MCFCFSFKKGLFIDQHHIALSGLIDRSILNDLTKNNISDMASSETPPLLLL